MPYYDIASVIENTDFLPPYFAVAQRALKLLRNADVQYHELSLTLENDQALVSKFLGVVNSASLSLQNRIMRVEQAIAYLGLRETRNIVMAVSTRDTFSNGQNRSTWLHSIAAAYLAEALAKNSRQGIDLNEAFSAGLLHDIGKAFLGKRLPEASQEITRWTRLGEPLLQAETRVVGFDHAVIGHMVLSRWNVPETIREAVKYHHDPWTGGSPLALVVALANQFAHRMDEADSPIDPKLLEYSQVREADISSLNSAVQMNIAQLESRLGSAS